MPDRPNVVFVCSDQHGYRYTGFGGHPYVETPNLDRLAAEGVVFENAYCASPVCTPSRASLLTGVYPSDVNSFCNSTVWDGSCPTWGTRLREAGYRTWSTGKFDLDPAHEVGFEEVETGHGHATSPDVTSLFRRPLCYRMGERPGVDGRSREERHADAGLADNAEAFLREEAPETDGPWAAWVGFSQPHPPFTALEEHFEHYHPGRVEPPNVPPGHLEDQHLTFQRLRAFKRVADPVPEERVRRARAGYYGAITELDEYVGRLLEALADAGELEDTVFVYTSDHGEMLGEHGLWYKNNLYEDAAHVPLVVAGAGLPEGEAVETPVGHVDLVHTLLEWAGADPPEPQRGHALDPLVEGRRAEAEHPGYAYAESHSEGNCTGSFMIRKGDWKYVHFTWYDDLLFDLAEDPNEFENRIDDPAAADVREELRDLLYEEVDPEAVTRRAFDRQEELLEEMAREEGKGLFEELRGRLGDGQARALVDRHTG
ncbi:MAG: sulfatase-like hydrolase/transferase [Halobacteriaceae archaeon]